MAASEWPWPLVIGLASALAMSGCAGLAVTALGVGASAGVTHTVAGAATRTFTAPMPKVSGATLTAFNRMGIKVASSSRVESNEVIKASTARRDIEVELEALTPNATRMRAVARNGVLYDSATAAEIVLQTEKALSTKGS